MVQMAPLRLYERETGIGLAVREVEVRNRPQQEVPGRHEVRVEDREELRVRLLATLFEGTGLVAVPIDAVQHTAVDACRRPDAGADVFDQIASVFVGGVV